MEPAEGRVIARLRMQGQWSEVRGGRKFAAASGKDWRAISFIKSLSSFFAIGIVGWWFDHEKVGL